ncbi:mitochondrial inner membrane protein required for protein import [Pichia californica]|uniref:Mitochondrial import inner membrane translocase subunit TIM50 n=1 Tax=Pichia californica TaxID=460514 RepID=A0A9P7BHC4_9ASCO|nr:mitochondrial inner membrane protein required for protein import [[Candida] californica]KAG0689854.1 mitochondrial inner membrane protein required for protein import [[Candida] californica]
MSAVLIKSALKSGLCLPIASVSPVRRLSNVIFTKNSVKNSSFIQTYRYYATSKDDKNSNKSILDDDLLSKAGVDTDEQPQANKQQESEEKPKDEFEQTRSRRNNTKSTIDKKKEFYSRMFWFSFLAANLGFVGYMARDYDPIEEPEIYKESDNGMSPSLIFKRLRTRLLGVSDVFSEPAFTDLLPPQPAGPYAQPMTLVLELDDLLVHSAWNYKKGWQTAKRPGLDYFLGYLSQYYEIVIFSRSSMAFAENTVAKLDPYHAFISYSLFKEVCRSKDGKLIKDLSLLNRDLSKVVIIDPDQDCYSMQPENAIPVAKWNGKKDDGLIKLIPFLEYLATSHTKDVRDVLKSFDDKDHIPEEFAIRENKMRQDWQEAQARKKSNDFFSTILGIPPSLRGAKKMPLDQIREQGQRNYLHMYNYLKENGEKLLKEEQEKTKELMADQKLTLGKIVNEGMPTAEDIARAAAEKQAQDAAAAASK